MLGALDSFASRVLYVPGFMCPRFYASPNSLRPGFYVSRASRDLCVPGAMCPGFYVSRVICVPVLCVPGYICPARQFRVNGRVRVRVRVWVIIGVCWVRIRA
jgi:hypothetical protein